jgi:hypothetical protein
MLALYQNNGNEKAAKNNLHSQPKQIRTTGMTALGLDYKSLSAKNGNRTDHSFQ